MHGDLKPAALVDESDTPARTKCEHALNRRYGGFRRQLIDGFSHDIRTPLTVINEYLKLLSEDSDIPQPDERRQIINVIADRVDDVNYAFGDLLDTLKLEAGTLGACRQACRLADIVASIRPSLERKAALRNGKLAFTIVADLPEVFCDKEQIGRVLHHVAGRAMKYSRPGDTTQVWTVSNSCQNEVRVGVTSLGEKGRSEMMAAVREGEEGAVSPKHGATNFGEKLRVVRAILRRNLSELVSESLSETDCWFSLPTAEPSEIVARYLKQRLGRLRSDLTVWIAQIHCPEPIDRRLEKEIQSLLGLFIRPTDLLLKIDQRDWLLARCRKCAALPEFGRRLETLRLAVNLKRTGQRLPAFCLKPFGACRSRDSIRATLEMLEPLLEHKQAAVSQDASSPAATEPDPRST
jgi:hypothetical protein